MRDKMQRQPTRTIPLDVLGLSADRSRWAQTFTRANTEDLMTPTIQAQLAKALNNAFPLKPGETIRIIDTPAKTHRLRDVHWDNPYWKGYQRQRQHLLGLEQAEADERARRHEQWKAVRFGSWNILTNSPK